MAFREDVLINNNHCKGGSKGRRFGRPICGMNADEWGGRGVVKVSN